MTKQLNLNLSISFKKAALLLSSLFMINLVYGATITWDGSASRDWGTAANWSSNSVPTSSDDVIIPNLDNEPIIETTGDFECNNLTIQNKGYLLNNGKLTVYGTLTGNGKYEHGSTTSYTKMVGTLDITVTGLSLKGTFEYAGSNQVIPNKDFYKVIISGTGITLDEDVVFKNVFDIKMGSTLTIGSGFTLTLTGTNVVINGTIDGLGTLALNVTGSGSTSNNLNVSGSGVVTSLVTMADEVTLVEGATVNLGQFTVNSSQTFTNDNILYYTPGSEPIIYGKLAGKGMMIIGTGVTHATVGNKGRFELTGSVSEIRTPTTSGFTNLYEYGTTSKTTTVGFNYNSSGNVSNSGASYRKFTIPASAPARLASGNARIAAGGRVFSLGSTPVPVTYVAFDGVLQGNSALISWATSMEYNNKEFIVEASADAVNFAQVASVNGVGTTNSLSNYSVTVTNPLKYYRLKQVDFDGVSSYSKIIEVSGENINEFSVFPNPFVGSELYVNYNGSTEVDGVIVKIYDLNEKVHFEASLNFFGNEVSKLQLTEKLNNGIYFVSIQSQTGVKIQKLLVE